MEEKAVVFDNFLDLQDFQKIQNKVTSEYFPWFYNNYILNENNTSSLYDQQFIHYVIKDNQITTDSEIYNVFEPLIRKLNPTSVLRLKLNLNIGTSIPYNTGMHIDIPKPNDDIKTAVFYINTNNGSTIFEDGTHINSVGNRLVVFDVNRKHEGITATDVKARYVANINFKTQDERKSSSI